MASSIKVGWGLYLGHAMSICVNTETIIGNNVNLSQMLNIGTNSGRGAMIGDRVYIGPMSCHVEDVQIGSNSNIGAGAVVCKDIPSGYTAVGVPAKVIGENRHQSFIRFPWPCESNSK